MVGLRSYAITLTIGSTTLVGTIGIVGSFFFLLWQVFFTWFILP